MIPLLERNILWYSRKKKWLLNWMWYLIYNINLQLLLFFINNRKIQWKINACHIFINLKKIERDILLSCFTSISFHLMNKFKLLII